MTEEVRTTSETGGQKGVKPENYALIPWDAMDEIARVYEFGAQKYAAHNYRKGYEWSKSFAALCRHIFAFWRGEDRDSESGLSHLAHAGFHVLGLLSFWLDKERYSKFDDRYKPEPSDVGDFRKEPGGWQRKLVTGGYTGARGYPHIDVGHGYQAGGILGVSYN